jgi:quercetin dioxygenase-like cupin family protein
MKRIIMLVAVLGWMFAATVARAQDPVKVDPKHYTVEFENDTVRVLRIHYGPGEKSVMHSHPQAIAVFLTDYETKMTFPGDKSERKDGKAGEVLMTPAGEHLPENVGDKPMELILVELKGQPAAK